MTKIIKDKSIVIDAFIKSLERLSRDQNTQELIPENLERVETQIRSQLEQHPESLSLHRYFSICLTRQNKIFDAKWHWEETVEQDPDNKDVHMAFCEFLAHATKLGSITKNEFTKQAENTYRLDLNNQEKIALNELGIMVNKHAPRAHSPAPEPD